MRASKWGVCVALLLVCALPVSALAGRHIAVILDTDVALDDIRALALLTQSDDVVLRGIVTSDGACSPSRGARNVRSVLRALGLSGIPVAAGSVLGLPAPPWRAMSESLGWSELPPTSDDTAGALGNGTRNGNGERRAKDLLVRLLKEADAPVTYLCLGPLTNLAAALDAEPSLGARIEALYYEGTAPGVPSPSWNTARDTSAARVVFGMQLPVLSFNLPENDLLAFNADLWHAACGSHAPVSQFICRLHADERVQHLIRSGHFRCWDETVVLGLLCPELCFSVTEPGRAGKKHVVRFDSRVARGVYLDLLSGEENHESGERRPVVLNEYPADPALLREDVRRVAPAIIERHGLAEWNAALLTNELHRHLGIYSLLGAKMGVRACEVLDAGIDELTVVSHAGRTPPLSCMTDGLQVATGASLGRGSIAVDPANSKPAAVFIKGSNQLTLCLKAEIAGRIQEDIRGIIRQHGSLTPAYWSAVRALALRYWLDMDRSEIFDESLAEESLEPTPDVRPRGAR
ncbi:MAG: nucleoside hydrolase [Candidatus Eisenbacteria bacterium]